MGRGRRDVRSGVAAAEVKGAGSMALASVSVGGRPQFPQVSSHEAKQAQSSAGLQVADRRSCCTLRRRPIAAQLAGMQRYFLGTNHSSRGTANVTRGRQVLPSLKWERGDAETSLVIWSRRGFNEMCRHIFSAPPSPRLLSSFLYFISSLQPRLSR